MQTENGPVVGSTEPFGRARRSYIVGISTESMR